MVQDIEKQKEPTILSEIIIIEETSLEQEKHYKNSDIEIIWKT